MSCGCGCCPKCGCRATCTCNRNIFSLDSSRTEFSYATGMSFDETDGQLSTAHDGASQSCCSTVAGENEGECVNCGWSAPGLRA